MKKHKIAVMTTTRAEYGLLRPVLLKIKAEKELELVLIVGGTHLAKEWGNTVAEIEKDDVTVHAEIYNLPEADNAVAICKSMGKTMIEVAQVLEKEQPALFLVLGDRYEIFAATAAAYTMNIPVAHIAGGEVTAGALDEAYRHGISKMARLHFTSNEVYRQRVIQLGEEPESVIMSGDIGSENIRNLPLLTKKELARELGSQIEKPYILATYHPLTLGERDCKQEMKILFEALSEFPELTVLFTMANADENGKKINQILDVYAQENKERVFLYPSLGQIRYLSAMKHSCMVLGNSSSGILEAPTMGVPTVNIGRRQEGRLRAASVIDCKIEKAEIVNAIKKAISTEFRQSIENTDTKSNPRQETSDIILKEMKRFLKENGGNKIKRFYDLPPERI